MQIFLNGEPQEIAENNTLQQLLETLALTQKRLAVEVNLQIVPRSQFSQHILQAGDKVEIIQAIGGG